MTRPVDMRAEVAALLFEFAACGQRKDLKAAAVGQHRAVPRRETVHASGTLDYLHAGTQIEVVGIGEYYVRLRLAFQVAVEYSLHCGRRAHGHEYRRGHRPVVGVRHTRTGATVAERMFEFEFHNCNIVCKDSNKREQKQTCLHFAERKYLRRSRSPKSREQKHARKL